MEFTRNLFSKINLIGIVIERAHMKRAWNILFFTFFTLCLFLFKPRQDVVFTAINETQYIRLFEEGQDFELCVDENYIFTGTYAISLDTVFLLYREPAESSTMNLDTRRPSYNKILPKKLYINKSASNIKSTDDLSFSAEIHIDMRQKLHAGQKANILAARQD